MLDPTAICAAESRHGKPCEQASIPDAPFAVCFEHGAELFRFLSGKLGAHATALEAAHRQTVDLTEQAVVTGRDVLVVYYLRIGELIKVGYTKQLRRRLHAYPPTAMLLAHEPGGKDLEQQRLAQFGATLAHSHEWFYPSVELLAHINSLRETPLTAADLAA